MHGVEEIKMKDGQSLLRLHTQEREITLSGGGYSTNKPRERYERYVEIGINYNAWLANMSV